MRLLRNAIAGAVVAGLAAGAAEAGGLDLHSSAFAPGGAIPKRLAADGLNRSPPLAWTPAPGARSYALVMDDPDAPMDRPFTHWVVWNIPGDWKSIPEGGAPGVTTGRNDAGVFGYFGPKPPSGVHHYHIRLWALDIAHLSLAGDDAETLAGAIRGHVIAEGELIGTFAH